MGGPGSGYGTKRPDHPTGALTRGIKKTYAQQTKHLKSVFSNKLDPSCHADKRARDRMAGLPDYGRAVIEKRNERRRKDGAELKAMEAKRRQDIALEARDLQDLARRLTNKAMQVAVEILDNPESNDTVKMQVINMLLDRGYGKPAATVLNINQDLSSKPSQLNDRSLDERIESTLARAERLTEGEAKETESPKGPINLRKYN